MVMPSVEAASLRRSPRVLHLSAMVLVVLLTATTCLAAAAPAQTAVDITTVAGIGTPCTNPVAAPHCGDGGAAADAQFTNPIDIQPIPAAQGGGYLVADEVDYMIRQISAAGTVATAVGNGTECSQWAGGGGTSSATQTCGVPGAASGVELGAVKEEGSGTAADVGQSGPTGADAASSGGVVIADRSAGVVLTSSSDSSTGRVSLLAGTGVPCQPLTPAACGDGGPATEAGLDAPNRAVPFDGGFLITEDAGNRVRWISPQGHIYTIAGREDGTSCSNSPNSVNDCGFSGATGGTATNPQSVYLNAPNGVAVLPASGDSACPTNDACFVATSSTNDVVIQVDVAATTLDTDPTAAIEAGTAGIIAGDFTDNELSTPSDVAAAGNGTVIIADTYDQEIRQLVPTGPLKYGALTTIAGTGAACSAPTDTSAPACGDGGSALSATFYTPYAVAVAGNGSVLVADHNEDRIRCITTTLVVPAGLTASANPGCAGQTITFGAMPAKPLVGGSGTVTATASSGLAVTLTVAASSSRVCSITAGGTGTAKVSYGTAGSCVIDGNQSGNSDYLAAPQRTQTLTVKLDPQSITIGASPPSASLVAGGNGTLSASASSGLPVTMTVAASSSTVCSISGGRSTSPAKISYLTAGPCVIDANQAGNVSHWAAAAQKTRTLTIKP